MLQQREGVGGCEPILCEGLSWQLPLWLVGVVNTMGMGKHEVVSRCHALVGGREGGFEGMTSAAH